MFSHSQGLLPLVSGLVISALFCPVFFYICSAEQSNSIKNWLVQFFFFVSGKYLPLFCCFCCCVSFVLFHFDLGATFFNQETQREAWNVRRGNVLITRQTRSEAQNMAIIAAAVGEVGAEEASPCTKYTTTTNTSRVYLCLYLRPCGCICTCICIFYVLRVAWQRQLWPIKAAIAIDKRASSSQKPKRQSRNAIASASKKCRYKCICICICVYWCVCIRVSSGCSVCSGLGMSMAQGSGWGRYCCCTLLLYMT